MHERGETIHAIQSRPGEPESGRGGEGAVGSHGIGAADGQMHNGGVANWSWMANIKPCQCNNVIGKHTPQGFSLQHLQDSPGQVPLPRWHACFR